MSGHSSQIFGHALGYGAIYEMTRILDAFRRELPEEGLTFSPGLILGGATAEVNADATGGSATGKANVIAASAFASGDIRTLDNEQTVRVEAKMRAIVAAHLPQTDAKISFDESYPAMAATPAGRELMRQWSEISVALGLGPVAESGVMTRGAGDIAFAAPYRGWIGWRRNARRGVSCRRREGVSRLSRAPGQAQRDPDGAAEPRAGGRTGRPMSPLHYWSGRDRRSGLLVPAGYWSSGRV